MKKLFVVGGGILLLCIVIILAIVLSQKTKIDSSSTEDYSSSYYTSCDNPTRSSVLGKYSKAAASTDAVPCGTIAIDILKRNGTAADATIAAMFCVGVINAQSSGLGGGFFATYYSKASGKAYALDAREIAPKAATSTMFNPKINPQLQGKQEKWYEKSSAIKGGLPVAVPGESVGLYELYRRFGGGVPWRDLIEPTIKICEEGHNLTWYTGGIMYPMRASILAEPSMSFLTNQTDERVLHEGETVYLPQLAKTLRVLQDEPYALYNGSLVQNFVKDLKKFGGIITEEDMRDYRPIWREPVHFHLENGNYTLHSFPPPGSGLIFGLILNILDEFHLKKSSLEGKELFRTHQLVAEAFKFSFAKKFQLGDLTKEEQETIINVLTSEEFSAHVRSKLNDRQTSQNPVSYGTGIVPAEDKGTAHFSLLAPNGDAVAITSTINYAYGAGIRSESTGIIYNNEMADFTTDAAYSKPGSMKMDKNLIVPGRRPLSSMCPAIFTDGHGDVKLILGAGGGSMIPTASAWVAARFLWMGQDLKKSIDECRSHHSLIPMKLQYETGFPQPVLDSLEQKGHSVVEYTWKSVVNGVGRSKGEIVANSDYRKSGQVDGF